jgi:hypothetical protein
MIGWLTLFDDPSTVLRHRGLPSTKLSGTEPVPLRDERPTLADVGISKKPYAKKYGGGPDVRVRSATQRLARRSSDIFVAAVRTA